MFVSWGMESYEGGRDNVESMKFANLCKPLNSWHFVITSLACKCVFPYNILEANCTKFGTLVRKIVGGCIDVGIVQTVKGTL